ncbi:Zinc knuckle [Ceratocystis platani]|uniref:Zinc knuckle n=1 Tax=Ceratocystis fimbriata f. sp. platani TaxID=88771 RepID=A0A0F8CUW4_CERFI|nr:Zinc knuckle [Ceratocystis platani]
MTTIFDGTNWGQWDANFILQLQAEKLQYLLTESPMEGVERDVTTSEEIKKQKDEDLAKRILELSLSRFFRVMVKDTKTLKEAYDKLKKACPVDTIDETFEDMDKIRQNPLRKDATILQNWMYFQTVCNEYVEGSDEDETIVFRIFLWLLPQEYREVAKMCCREKTKPDEAIKQLEMIRRAKPDSQAKYNKAKSKCFNCGKEGHLKTECWSKKKTSTKQKANQATEEKPSRDKTDS